MQSWFSPDFDLKEPKIFYIIKKKTKIFKLINQISIMN